MAAESRQGQRYAKGDAVEVKHKGFGQGPVWVPGTVQRTDGGRGHGLFVAAKGKTDFYSWSCVRPAQREQEPAPLRAPLTAVAGVADLRQFVKQDSLKQIEFPAPPKSTAAEPAERERTERAPKRLKAHRLTRVGEIFRRVRLARNLSQEEFGTFIGCSYGHVSNLELGEQLPSDEQLLRFSEAFGYDLAALEEARGRDLRDQQRDALPRLRTRRRNRCPCPTPTSKANPSNTPR